MLYKPLKERLWDTWIVNENSKYYLFYIRVSENGTRWDGISLAISDDLIHWKEHGTVLKKDDEAVWLGTGMVQRIGNKFIMNYSQEKPEGQQKIFFAESQDLLNWTKIPDLEFRPDDDIYLRSTDRISDAYTRWDSLGIVNALDKNNKAPYYAFMTADSARFEQAQKRGVLGCCTSEDGLHWKHLKPATVKMDIVPAFEVPEHIEINGNHYAIFCTSSKLGFRFDPYAKDVSGGTYYVCSDNLLGPYDFPKTDPMLVGARDNNNVTMGSVGRVIYDDDAIIFYHIWGDPIADGWVGLVKELVEVKKGELQLKYWRKNDGLINFNNYLSQDKINFEPTKKIGKLLAVDWNITKKAISFGNIGSSGSIMSDELGFKDEASALADGRVISFDLEFEGLGAGVVLKTESDQDVCIFLNQRDKTLDFTKVTEGFCSNLVLQGIMSKDNEELAKKSFNVKIFVRKYFAEVYLNDTYISGLRLTELFRNNVFGFYAEDSSGTINNLNIYQMK